MGLLFGNKGKQRRASGPRCPRCGSTDTEKTGEFLAPMPGHGFLQLGDTNILPMAHYRCDSCGHEWDDIAG